MATIEQQLQSALAGFARCEELQPKQRLRAALAFIDLWERKPPRQRKAKQGSEWIRTNQTAQAD